MSLISIIMPYFQKRNFIIKSINSVLKQTYKNFELIIIYDDDNKEDLIFLKKFCKIDKRIKILVNKKQIGAGESRNVGISKAKGEYIAFLDADDLWNKNKLKKQLLFMKNDKIKCCHTSYNIISGSKIIGQRLARSFHNLDDLLKSCDIGLSTVIIKKSIFNNKIKFAKTKTKEDFILWLKILQKGNDFIAYQGNLTTWRKSPNSLSSSIIQKLFDGISVYNKHMNFNIIKSMYYLFLLSINYLRKSNNE